MIDMIRNGNMSMPKKPMKRHWFVVYLSGSLSSAEKCEASLVSGGFAFGEII